MYRFGHSMLTETVDAHSPDGVDTTSTSSTRSSTRRLHAPGQTPENAAGNIIRGMTRQVGNELDEFVTAPCATGLLGLPLDLADVEHGSCPRHRDPGAQRGPADFYAESGNPASALHQLGGLRLQHQERGSLVNFIAAYGTHPSITARRRPRRAKRAAARRRSSTLRPTASAAGQTRTTSSTPPVAYGITASGVTTTGVDAIDLWMGGLAEKQMVFGGLLGPTFNYVFENQMENLQDGDRFYYLSRTAGLNMLTQLEGNSFAELIMRNTDVEALPADSFSRPAFIFDIGRMSATGPIIDDPAHGVERDALLVRMPDGTIRYAGPEHVVFNGTARANDRDAGPVRATTPLRATAATTASKAVTASTNSSAVSVTTSSPTCSATTP